MLTNEKGHTKYGLFHDKNGFFAPFLALLPDCYLAYLPIFSYGSLSRMGMRVRPGRIIGFGMGMGMGMGKLSLMAHLSN